MNCHDQIPALHELADGTLPPAAQKTLEAHLAHCPACQAELAALQALRAKTRALEKELAPQRDLWPSIAAELDSASATPLPARRSRPHRADSPGEPVLAVLWRRLLPFAAAILVAALIVAGAGIWWRHSQAPAWAVAAISGAPQVNSHSIHDSSRLRVGQWLETDHASRARVEVGRIGEVQVEPNSRVRLVEADATDHRLELARGTLHALIWAPPRLFFVDTPAGTAVDLGCAYTLSVDDAGSGVLHVTAGYVALEYRDRESLISAGMMCVTRPGSGPGTPFRMDAPGGLRTALQRFDFEPDGNAVLADILAQTGAEDAATLWHLLARAPESERGRVFDLLASLYPPPAGVTRDGIIRGKQSMRRQWGDSLGLASYDP